MPGSKTLVWIERLIWVLIYGGLLAVSLGLFMSRGESAAFGYFLLVKGGIAAAAGVVLIWLRSRWP